MRPTVVVIGFEDLCDGFRRLGLQVGGGVMVHSSLSSFGHVLGGARTVIEALMEVVTPEGTLMMPSFNHGEPFGPGGQVIIILAKPGRRMGLSLIFSGGCQASNAVLIRRIRLQRGGRMLNATPAATTAR